MSNERDVDITQEMPRFPLNEAESVFDDPSETGPVVRPFESSGPMVPTLRVAAGVELMRFAPLRPDGQIVIGRGEAAEMRLDHRTVSSRHARASSDGEGNVNLIDLGSRNGTAVNGERITRTNLLPGDYIEIGAVPLVLELLTREELEHLGEIERRSEAPQFEADTGLYRAIDDLPPDVVADPMLTVAALRLDATEAIARAAGSDALARVCRNVGLLVHHGVGAARPVVRHRQDVLLVFVPKLGEARTLYLLNGVRRSVLHHPWHRTAEGIQVTVSGALAQITPPETVSDLANRVRSALDDCAPGVLRPLSRA